MSPLDAPLSNPSLPEGYRHTGLGDTASTNQDCLQAAAMGDAGNLWITGVRQLTGKGSRGRNWVSEPGNLYASLLLRDPGPIEKLHTLTFTASLAIRDAILGLHGAAFHEVALKWPNDVLVDRCKVSGILLEAHTLADTRYVIIGIGVNLRHHPANTLHPATDLSASGLQVSRVEFFSRLASAVAARLIQWDRGEGFASIREDWLKAASGLGERLSVRLPGKDGEPALVGTFVGIDDSGRLLLQTSATVERISVADIFFA